MLSLLAPFSGQKARLWLLCGPHPLSPGSCQQLTFQKLVVHRCLETGPASALPGTWPCCSACGRTMFLAMPSDCQVVHQSKGQVPGTVFGSQWQQFPCRHSSTVCVLRMEQAPVIQHKGKLNWMFASTLAHGLILSQEKRNKIFLLYLLQVALLLRSEDTRSYSLKLGQAYPPARKHCRACHRSSLECPNVVTNHSPFQRNTKETQKPPDKW